MGTRWSGKTRSQLIILLFILYNRTIQYQHHPKQAPPLWPDSSFILYSSPQSPPCITQFIAMELNKLLSKQEQPHKGSETSHQQQPPQEQQLSKQQQPPKQADPPKKLEDCLMAKEPPKEQQSSKIKQKGESKSYKLLIEEGGRRVYTFEGFEEYPFQIDGQYELEMIKGWGTYSIVCSGRNTVSNQLVAIKRIHNVFDDLGDTRRILRQIKILEFLKHRNIVGLKDILPIPNPQNFQSVYLVMEYMEYTLKRLVQSQQTPLTQQMVQFILYQLLSGISFMHSADIIHRDLKPENILISKKLQLKIADMNLAKKEVANDENTYYVTSRPYRAPEIFINPNSYTKAIDVWSVGCIFAQMLGKTVIFLGKDFVDQLRRFVAILGKPKLQIFADIDANTAQGLARVFRDIPDRDKVDWKFLFPKASEKALDLLDHMLVYDPKERFTAEECLQHPFLEAFRSRPRPKCQQIFDFSFDKQNMTAATLRQAIFSEVESFQMNKLGRASGGSDASGGDKKLKV